MRATVPVVESPVGLWLCPPLPGGPGVCERCSGPCDDPGTDRGKSCPHRRPALVHANRQTGGSSIFKEPHVTFQLPQGACGPDQPGEEPHVSVNADPCARASTGRGSAAEWRDSCSRTNCSHTGCAPVPPRPRGPPDPADGPRLQMACCDRAQKQVIGAGGQLLPPRGHGRLCSRRCRAKA